MLHPSRSICGSDPAGWSRWSARSSVPTGTGCAGSWRHCSIRSRTVRRPPRSRAPTASSASSGRSAPPSGERRTRSSTSPASAATDRDSTRGRRGRDAGRPGLRRPVDGPELRPERLERLVEQASLQVEARGTSRSTPAVPGHRARPRMPVWGRGFELLPAPDDGDVFLDFEGDPFWRADAGLFFLFGLIARDADRYLAVPGASGPTTGRRRRRPPATLIEYLAGRRDAVPGHARLPLQPHGAFGAREPDGRPWRA